MCPCCFSGLLSLLVCLFSFIFRYAHLLSPQPDLLTEQACLEGRAGGHSSWCRSHLSLILSCLFKGPAQCGKRAKLPSEHTCLSVWVEGSVWRGVGERRAWECLFLSEVLLLPFSLSPRRGNPYAGGLGEQHHCWVGSPQGTAEGCIGDVLAVSCCLRCFLSPVMLSALCTGRWPHCHMIIGLWLGLFFFSLFCSLPFYSYGVWGRREKWLSTIPRNQFLICHSSAWRGISSLHISLGQAGCWECGTGILYTWTSGKAPLRVCIILHPCWELISLLLSPVLPGISLISL